MKRISQCELLLKYFKKNPNKLIPVWDVIRESRCATYGRPIKEIRRMYWDDKVLNATKYDYDSGYKNGYYMFVTDNEKAKRNLIKFYQLRQKEIDEHSKQKSTKNSSRKVSVEYKVTGR